MKREIDMCHGPLLGNILRYTLPLICTGLLQLLFNAADLVVVGRFCGSVSVGAVGATSALINLIIYLFIGLSVGVGVTVAQSIGAGQEESTRQAVHTAVPVALTSGLALTVLGVWLAPQVLRWMGTPADVIGLSTVYVRVYFCGMIPSMVYNYGGAILRAAGDSKSPLLYLSIAGVVNVALNVLFVTAFDMDVAGVALATALSQLLSAALVVRALMRRTDACRLDWRQLRIHKRSLLQMVRIGLPAGVQGWMFSLSNVLIQSAVNSFGSMAVSGNAAASSIEGFVYVAMNAFYQTAMNFTGQNIGARQYNRVRQICRVSLMCVAVTGLVLGVGVYLLRRPLLGIYITDSPEALAVGMQKMLCICFPYALCGVMEVLTGVLRGMGASFVPMLMSVVGICGLRVVWIGTVFQYFHTLPSLFISWPISWVILIVALSLTYLVLYRRLTKQALEVVHE